MKNLLAKLHHSESSPPRFFFAVYLTDDIVQTAIWQIKQDQVEIFNLGSLLSWDGRQASSLVKAVDDSLAAVLAEFDSNGQPEPDQVIFGLPASWLDKTNDLQPDKKKLLQELSRRLELKPLGFTLFIESLLIYLQQQEGTPLNALLFHLNDLELHLFLIRQSKFIQTETLDRTDDFVSDVEALIKHLDQTKPLPSRILLFDGHHNLQELSQLLNSQDWSQTFNFLHLPQIEALPQDIGIRAVALAGGREIAKSLGLLSSASQAEPLAAPLPSTTPISPTPPADQLKELGFSLDSDQVQPSSSPPSPQAKPKKHLPKLALPSLSLPSFSFKLPHFQLNKLPLVFGLLFLVLSLSLLGAFFWFVPQADLTLYLQPKNIQTDLELNDNSLPAQTFRYVLSGHKSLSTTGSGLVGDKAKGKVTIYNRTSLPKTFLSGTILTAQKLKFTLTDSVTVASKSTSADYTEIPGKSEAGIVAQAIGDQYNLPAQTEFQIASYSPSSFIARNQQALTGGNSRQVQTVSKADLRSLYQELVSQLQTDFKTAIATQSADLVFTQPDFKVLDKTYSHQLGDQADKLDLDLKLEFYGSSYHKQDILNLVKSKLKDRIPLGFHQLDNSLDLVPAPSSTSSSLKFQAKISLLPDLDLSSLAKLLRGKSPDQVSRLLHSLIPEFSHASLNLTPAWLPPKLRFLPLNSRRLHLSIQAK